MSSYTEKNFLLQIEFHPGMKLYLFHSGMRFSFSSCDEFHPGYM